MLGSEIIFFSAVPPALRAYGLTGLAQPIKAGIFNTGIPLRSGVVALVIAPVIDKNSGLKTPDILVDRRIPALRGNIPEERVDLSVVGAKLGHLVFDILDIQIFVGFIPGIGLLQLVVLAAQIQTVFVVPVRDGVVQFQQDPVPVAGIRQLFEDISAEGGV